MAGSWIVGLGGVLRAESAARPRLARRQVGIFLLASLLAGPRFGPSTSARAASIEVEELAAVEAASLGPPPLFLAVAKVIVPPGAAVAGGDTAGPRLLVVETGSLTVAAAESTAGLGRTGGVHPWVQERVVPAGGRLGLATGVIGGLRNDGARPVAYLDAALFPVADQPSDAAFTTDDGVSFQLLAGAILEEAPRGPVRFRLRRVLLGAGEGLPAGPWAGPALVRVESGALRLIASIEGLRYSRAAAAAPYSAAGPMRPVAAGRTVALTAGSSLLLPAGATIASGNERETPATLLVLEVVPVGEDGERPAADPVR